MESAQRFSTTAQPEIEVILDKPYNTTSGEIPHATVNMLIPESTVTYAGTTFRKFTADITAGLPGATISTWPT